MKVVRLAPRPFFTALGISSAIIVLLSFMGWRIYYQDALQASEKTKDELSKQKDTAQQALDEARYNLNQRDTEIAKLNEKLRSIEEGNTPDLIAADNTSENPLIQFGDVHDTEMSDIHIGGKTDRPLLGVEKGVRNKFDNMTYGNNAEQSPEIEKPDEK